MTLVDEYVIPNRRASERREALTAFGSPDAIAVDSIVGWIGADVTVARMTAVADGSTVKVGNGIVEGDGVSALRGVNGAVHPTRNTEPSAIEMTLCIKFTAATPWQPIFHVYPYCMSAC